jgi:hypothetical protein
VKKPSIVATKWAKRIAHGDGALVTIVGGREICSSRDNGVPIPQSIVSELLRCGVPLKDERGLFDLPQSYRARPPSDPR